MTTAPLPDYCWPVDHSCCPTFPADGFPTDDNGAAEALWATADALAGMTLRMLTGYRVGGCPVKVRPCRSGCLPETWRTYPAPGAGVPGGSMYPVLSSGTWLNIGCGCAADGCSCTRVCEVTLDGPVGHIAEVKVDGAVLDPSAYRLDGGNRLVRTDAECWPLCQNIEADDTEPGTFSVTYAPGARVDGLGAYAAGLLACEFAKACSGQPCALPTGVVSVVRAGVTYQLASETWAKGLTGIRAVDAYIRRWNPNNLTQASAVWSPDVHHPRLVSR